MHMEKVDIETLRFLDRHQSLKLIFNCHGRLEHDQGSGKSGRQIVNEEMRKADFLILLHGTGEICDLYIPSKAYEYLWARRPIVVTTHPSRMEEVYGRKHTFHCRPK